ncbi:MAG: electron transport complex subunit RsxA [Candidatus Margulisbacteria bacterium]|nr:electron transport complex subunit RsxA [Candidatus Margulisiibacteriota bacterium]
MGKLLFLLVQAALINNFVLARFLGICPFIGVSNNFQSAGGMGMAVTFVMLVASIATWFIQKLILVPLHAEYLQVIFFILVIAGLVQFIEMIINKKSPVLKRMLGIYLPLITTNCAVLGVAVINVMNNYNLLESIIYSIGGGLGFTLALFLMAGIRERLEEANVPRIFKGVPIAFITGGLLSLSFILFSSF